MTTHGYTSDDAIPGRYPETRGLLQEGSDMTSFGFALRELMDRIARLLTREIFPDDTAPVVPVSPIPSAIRIHREPEQRRDH
jgi:hypothetical protein